MIDEKEENAQIRLQAKQILLGAVPKSVICGDHTKATKYKEALGALVAAINLKSCDKKTPTKLDMQ